MKNLNYGADYLYPHDFDIHFTTQEYMPDALKNTRFYQPADNEREKEQLRRMKQYWNDKYNY